MSGGLNPGRHFAIALGIGLLLSIGLYCLPKTLVKNEGEPEDQSANSSENSQTEHTALSLELVSDLKKLCDSGLDENQELLALSQLFADNNIYDSAAYYSGSLAQVNDTELDWLRTGDYYYQAYSLSLNPTRQEDMAAKARQAYQKVLEINPRQYQAKTNIAMTYTTSSSPMQAILMLRQILEDEPRYVPAIMSMGALSMQSGQYDRAVSRFEQVLTIDPKNVNAKLGLAYSWIETGNVEKGKDLLIEISKEDIGEVLQNEISNTLKSLK